MSLFLTISTILGLTAVFSFVNQRFLRLQQTIGLMVLALASTLILGGLDAGGANDVVPQVQAFVSGLALNETLLNGVLCFILFAGSINVKARVLREEKWVILTPAIGATLDLDQRRKHMEGLQKMLQTDAVIAQPFWHPVFAAGNERVQGYKIHPSLYHHQLNEVWMA